MCFINNLEIINFRNIKELKLKIKDKINYFFAPNGTGKTNLLEAIQLLTLGKSLRTRTQSNILPFYKQDCIKLIIKGNIEIEENIIISQEVIIEKNIKLTKKLFINTNKKKLHNYIGNTPTIWFSLENIKVLTSSPSNKRKFIDQILMQLSPTYCEAYNNYYRSLKQRNKLLKNEDSITRQKDLINIWTDNLIKYGSIILEKRFKFFQQINQKLIIKNNPRYKFKIIYKPNPNITSVYDIEKTKDEYKKQMEKIYEKDIILQTTTVGPHKDNWQIYFKVSSTVNWIYLDYYGSRGQQRMALISLINVLIEIFNEVKGKKPILLLDDVFSELDDLNIQVLTEMIKQTNCQIFATGVREVNLDINANMINLLDLIK